MDTVPFKVDICSCQAIQLTHTQAGSHKNDDIIIIVAAIVLNELQIFLLLFSGQGIAHISVLRHNVRQLELEWILADNRTGKLSFSAHRLSALYTFSSLFKVT